MAANDHRAYIYVGLAGGGQYVGDGGLYRYAVGDRTWQSITRGLPSAPQVRALLVRPDDPAVLYAGTQYGPYRSDDCGEHWEALDTPREGRDVWSLACHPEDPDVLCAGYEPCGIERSEDGGGRWQRMDTDGVVFPHIITSMSPRPSASSASRPIPRTPSTCTPPSKSAACSAVGTVARAGPR